MYREKRKSSVPFVCFSTVASPALVPHYLPSISHPCRSLWSCRDGENKHMGCAAAGSDTRDVHFHKHLSTRKCCNICRSGPASSCFLDFTFLSHPDLPLGPLTFEMKAALSEGAGPHRSLWGRRPPDLSPLTCMDTLILLPLSLFQCFPMP